MVNSLVQRNFMSTIQELESYKVSIWECNKLPKPPSSSLSSTKNLNYYVIGWQQADLRVVRVIGCFVLMRLTTSILLALILNISLPLFGAKALITFSFCLKEYQKMKTGLEGDRAYLPMLFTVKFVYLSSSCTLDWKFAAICAPIRLTQELSLFNQINLKSAFPSVFEKIHFFLSNMFKRDKLRDLLTWMWRTPGRWGNPPSRGRKIARVCIQSYNPGLPGWSFSRLLLYLQLRNLNCHYSDAW